MAAELTLREPDREVRSVKLTPSGPIGVGRGSQADLIVIDKEISRLHFELEWTDGAWAIADLGSLNGTYVNDSRIERRVLSSGDEILIGQTLMTFIRTDEDEDELFSHNEALRHRRPPLPSEAPPRRTGEQEEQANMHTMTCAVCGATFDATADAASPVLCSDCAAASEGTAERSGESRAGESRQSESFDCSTVPPFTGSRAPAPRQEVGEAARLGGTFKQSLDVGGANGSPLTVAPGEAEVIRIEHEDTIDAFLERHPNDAANIVFSWRQVMWYTLIAGAVILLALYDPLHFLHMAHLLSGFYLVVIMYKVACVLLSAVRKREIQVSPSEIAALSDDELPIYTILVPLYKEREVAAKIIRTLERLDYPKDKLDVKLLLEPDDPDTFHACRAANLPPYCEIIICPESLPKTKPKACNHGLKRAKGEYVVIYDAEDRPEPDQLKKAIVAFKRCGAAFQAADLSHRQAGKPAPHNVICLQAKLNYYNPKQNTLTRWFTIEYSTWFDLFLPGLHAMGAPIPLGGTSNHFKADVLKDIRGWDPFNVTEDCDLGIRLHKMGYRTRVLDSTTWEEANSRVGNWIRQRSRWVKGYIQTHLVHMRRPLSLMRKMGAWGTFSFLSSVGGLSLMLLLNPIFWVIGASYLGCWAVDLHANGWDFGATLSLPYAERWVWQMWFSDATNPGYEPFWNAVSQLFYVMTIMLLAGNFFFVFMHVLACIRRRTFSLIPWAVISPLYWVLISIAAWKGFLQLFFRPFYWEKTTHGLDE